MIQQIGLTEFPMASVHPFSSQIKLCLFQVGVTWIKKKNKLARNKKITPTVPLEWRLIDSTKGMKQEIILWEVNWPKLTVMIIFYSPIYPTPFSVQTSEPFFIYCISPILTRSDKFKHRSDVRYARLLRSGFLIVHSASSESLPVCVSAFVDAASCWQG